ncbi:hypothetical protein [Rhodococcus sp. 14-2470-1a]|uniref:hypothetical protein n=1 Tax=Rhodococcus sp. 14-2470-1a TaxID=2023150 RepID=UPI000B9BD34C|nr:hypothetical protein [Rhodococcus sp. 14-2470-1a]OZF41884.1 hypothetical protein CH292_27135 [Rhodococcus sp. 14-2470-1a]
MKAAGTRVSFKFDMPSRVEQGSGVVSPDGDEGFLVLDDVRLDSGKSAARIWIPLHKLRLLWADELPAGSGHDRIRGFKVSRETVLLMGDVVLDADRIAWAMYSDKLLRSASFNHDHALTLDQLVDARGPITFHGHDDDEAGN